MNERNLNPADEIDFFNGFPEELKPFVAAEFSFFSLEATQLVYQVASDLRKDCNIAVCIIPYPYNQRITFTRYMSFDELRKIAGVEFFVFDANDKLIAEWSPA